MPSELSEILARAAAGCPPPPDGGVAVLAQPSARDAGVISFTAHSIVFADVPPGWVHAMLPDDDPGAPLSPQFLLALADRLGRRAIGCVDMLTVAPALPGPPPVPPPLDEVTDSDHPRVARARRYRDDTRIWTGGGATVMIGRGVAGRYEVAVEVDPDRQGKGVGRAALIAARHLVPAAQPLWAQIAPGNAASVRTFLAAGFVPAGAEALLSR
ncbi:MAG TPA: GNAT family N-acetyltransferase [Streptosporangiaceae bacterium]|jgi:GNAT superfamily N-acetyltransferase